MACVNTGSAEAWLIHEGESLHLQHGPIDLIVNGSGSKRSVQIAFEQAHLAFQDVLQTLVEELPLLRTPVATLADQQIQFRGPVAKLMQQASLPYQNQFVTPMAAVAGSVADYVLRACLEQNSMTRLMVNNGGDIAIFLAPTQTCRVGICCDLDTASHTDFITVHANDGIGGVATSGWQGRSQSLGIADAVTVLADNAAMADVAATLIANAIDLPHSKKVHRQPAVNLNPDTDLGTRAATVGVDELTGSEIETALLPGANLAERLLQQRLIHCAYLHLQGTTRLVPACGQTGIENQLENIPARLIA